MVLVSSVGVNLNIDIANMCGDITNRIGNSANMCARSAKRREGRDAHIED